MFVYKTVILLFCTGVKSLALKEGYIETGFLKATAEKSFRPKHLEVTGDQ